MKDRPDPPARFTLRRLAPADAAPFQSLRLDGLRESPEAFAASFGEEAEKPLSWFSERLAGRIVFGGFAGAELVGVAGLRVETTAKLAHIGHLWGLFVAAKARREGLADALTRRVLDEARGVVEQVHLAVVSSNEAAIRLYTAAGFKEYGLERRALKVDGRYHDEILMAREVEPRR
jgi:RimJ/RimL family protein N-acetyltransferase